MNRGEAENDSVRSLELVASRQNAGPAPVQAGIDESRGRRPPQRSDGAGIAGVAQMASPHPERSQVWAEASETGNIVKTIGTIKRR